jgi:Ankyrin repeats (3 copies)
MHLQQYLLAAHTLQDAARYDKVALAALLLHFGGDSVIDKRNHDGDTPLIIAAREGHIDLVRLLCAFGASTTLRGALHMTAVAWARRRCFPEVVYLLEQTHNGFAPPRPKIVVPLFAIDESRMAFLLGLLPKLEEVNSSWAVKPVFNAVSRSFSQHRMYERNLVKVILEYVEFAHKRPSVKLQYRPPANKPRRRIFGKFPASENWEEFMLTAEFEPGIQRARDEQMQAQQQQQQSNGGIHPFPMMQRR